MSTQYIVGGVIFIISLFGLSCNWFIVLFISRVKSLRNPFGKMTTSQALAEAILLSAFAFLVAPMVFFDIEFLYDNSRYIGTLLLMCVDIGAFAHCFISFNRFTAMMFPLKVDKVFNDRSTNVINAFCWTAAILPSIYFYIITDCHLFFSRELFSFTFTPTAQCFAIAWYYDFIKTISLTFVIVVVDGITVARLHLFNSTVSGLAPGQEAQHISRRQNEINFLKQACLQALVFVVELVSYFVISPYFDNFWIKFVMTTTAWCLLHTLDGVITLSYNREFRLVFKKTFDRLSSNSGTNYERTAAPTTSQSHSKRTATLNQ